MYTYLVLNSAKNLIKCLHIVFTKLEKCDWNEVYLSEYAQLYSDGLFDLYMFSKCL